MDKNETQKWKREKEKKYSAYNKTMHKNKGGELKREKKQEKDKTKK